MPSVHRGPQSSKQILEYRLARPDTTTFSSPDETKQFLKLKLADQERDIFACLFLDNRHRLIQYSELFYGTIDGASVHPREVVKAALKCNAAAVILSHNHPSGVAEPSRADEAIELGEEDKQAALEEQKESIIRHLSTAMGIGGKTRKASSNIERIRKAVATGLREANVTGLEWSQVDLSRRIAWIHPDQAKAKKAISVLLNADAVIVIRQQTGKHKTRVFSYKGNPVKKAGTKAWRKALERAGIEDFRWHDLRHTWASWHVQNGTPLHVLQELGGWSTFDMVRRYAHLSAEHLAEYAGNISGLKVAGNNHTEKDETKVAAKLATRKNRQKR